MKPIWMTFVGAGVAAVLLAAVLYSRLPESATPQKDRTSAASMTAPQLVAYPRADNPAPGKAGTSAPSEAMQKQHLTKSAEVDTLLKTGDPKAAFAAYKIVATCVFSRTHEARALNDPRFVVKRNWTSPAEACGDLSPGQIASRMEGLGRAADAGVPGSVEAFALEGPEGNGWSNYNPALVAAWEERAKAQMGAGARNGDRWSISTLATNFEQGDPAIRDLTKALAYVSAQQEITVLQLGQPDPNVGNWIARLTNQVGPEKAKVAIEQGKQLVAQAKASPLWSAQ